MGSGQLRSYLTRHAVVAIDAERIKREAWRNNGDLVLMAHQIESLPLPEKRVIEQIATRAYGYKILNGVVK